MMVWTFTDSRGFPSIGRVISTHDFGGTDIRYQMQLLDANGDDVPGRISMLSGSRLKAAKRVRLEDVR